MQRPGRLQDHLKPLEAVGTARMNRFGLPNLGLGLGLRTVHYADVLKRESELGWFEIISENYLNTQGRPLLFLDRIAERSPIVMHGVSLSIGSTAPLDFDYLRQLRHLRERIKAPWLSDHLCWTGVQGHNTHDLLPLPYTEEALRHVIERVRQVQDFFECHIALENPSTYLEFEGKTLTEWEFISALAHEADCALLLDVNNVYVSSVNHGFDPWTYLRNVPHDRIVQLHVAGHSRRGGLLIDTHDGVVCDPVIELLAAVRSRTPHVPLMLEWDADVPSFELTLSEARRVNELSMPHAGLLALATDPAPSGDHEERGDSTP